MTLEEIQIPKKKIEILNKKGIKNLETLLCTKPRKYLYFDVFQKLELSAELKRLMEENTEVAIIGVLTDVNNVYKNNMSLIKLRVTEKYTQKTLFINLIGQYTKLNYYKSLIGIEVIVGGKLSYSQEYKTFSMFNPEIISGNIKKYNRIIPVYSKYKGISEEYYEQMIETAIKEKGEIDYLPYRLIEKYKLLPFIEAVKAIHYPKTKNDITNGNKRLVFDQILYLANKLQIQNVINKKESPYKINTTAKMKEMLSNLPFELTEGQNNAIATMCTQALKGERISSFVQGDVGTGKTMVAFSMMIAMAENGYQSVLMAPTAILAKQHYLELQSKTEKLGLKAVFLCNELKSAEKKKVLQEIKEHKCDFIVGTHSCVSKTVEYANLALTITDEEHKFGVLQRQALIDKAESGVHNIIMSGTPIPRTLANTLYGNSTTVYTLNLPKNRQPIQTAICTSQKPIFEWMLREINNGHQCYVVCPLIDKSDEDSKMKGISSIEETSIIYENYFEPLGVKCAVVTGKTTKEEQTRIFKEYANNNIQILIATSVIEVGINVPNATVMVITSAERFGLAALHQLRGRVGRGSDKSYCILQKSPNSNGGSNLEILCRQTDGLEIAKEDLKNRGTGNILGTEQSGNNKYIKLMLEYPNMYEKIKVIAEDMCKNSTGRDFIKMYEEIFE